MGKNLKYFNLAVLYGIIYFLFCLFLFLSVTAPSDPLQYVKPALYPDNGFEFLDRIIVWLWIRFIAIFPIKLEYIGGISTLLLVTFTLVLGLFWLYKKVNIYAMNVFFILFFLSDIILPISSYTYPTQMLTFIIFSTLIVLSLINNKHIKFFLAGIGATIAIFSKIQAYPFFIFLFLYIFINSKGYKEVIKNQFIALMGIISGLIIIVSIITLTDGITLINKIIVQYFENTVNVQAEGRNLGGIPPFHKYLNNPTVLFSLIGCSCAIMFKKFQELKLFAFAGLFQLLGLILIYIVTQRGGPLINNYILDFVVIGLFIFSALVGKLFYQEFKKYHKYLIVLPIFSILIAYFWICFFNNSLNKDILKILNIIFILIISLFFIYKKNFKVTGFLICIFWFGYSSKSGVEDALFKKHYWDNTYILAKDISLLNEKYIWVAAKINRNTIEDGSWRIKEVYTTFYENKNKFVYFGEHEPEKYNLLITDSAYLINKYHDNTTILYAPNYRIIDSKGEYNIKNNTIFQKNTNKKLFLMLDYSFSDYNLKLKDNMEFILSSDISNNKNNIKGFEMYIQYKIENKYVRTLATKSNKAYEITLTIPKGANEISYGWLINDIEDQVELTDIKMQNFVVENIDEKHLKHIGIK